MAAAGEDGDAPFLFDDSWLHKRITVGELDAREWRIELFQGWRARWHS